MPSPEKTARIYEICAEHDLDYFGNERHKQSIEFILMEEFPDESEYNRNVSSEGQQHTDMRTWRVINREEDNDAEEDSSIGYWLFGCSVVGVVVGLILAYWEVFLQILFFLAIIAFFGIKGLIAALAGSAASSSSDSSWSSSGSSGSSKSHKKSEYVTYAVERFNGASWVIVAQGVETFCMYRIDQLRAKDNANYRIVRMVNGKSSGTIYS